MKKLFILIILVCFILLITSCGNVIPERTYTVTLYDGRVLKGVRNIDITNGKLKGYLPDGAKIYAHGNWYLIEED